MADHTIIRSQEAPNADLTEVASRAYVPPQRYEALRMYMRNKAAVFGAVLMFFILVATFIAPLFISATGSDIVAERHLAPGTEGAPFFGTDYLGRDVGIVTLNGGSTTLKVAGFAALLIVSVGATVGAFAGYYGGMVDTVLMKITEFFQVLPGLLLALVIASLWGISTVTIVIAIGMVIWPGVARVTRSEFMRQKNLEYVRSARAIGASNGRIIVRTILPNTLPILIVQATLTMGAAILLEAGLSFLGLGNPRDLSWGYYTGVNRSYFTINWWAVTVPGSMVFMTVLSLSLIGDGIQDAINPKLRGRQ